MNRRGLTLLELVLVTSLIGVVGLSFAFLYTSAQRFLIQSVNFTASQGDASFGLEHIKRRLLQATAIDNPGWPPVPPAAETRLALSGGGTFQFTWQRRIPPGTGVLETLNSAYRLDGGNLFFDENRSAPSAQPIGRGILDVVFTRTGPHIVAVEIVSERASGGDTRQTRLQTIVAPRGMS